MYESWVEMKAITDADPTLDFEYLVQGEMPGEEAQIAAVRRNRFQMAGLSWLGMSTLISELNVTFSPFLFESLEEAHFVYDNFLFEPMSELFEEKGLVLISYAEAGWTVLFGNQPLLRPEDVKGRKFRTSPNPAYRFFLEAVGADRIALSYDGIVSGMQTGLIEGGLTSEIFYFFAILDAAPHVTFARLAYNGGGVFANREWLESLTPAQRNIVLTGYPDGPAIRALQIKWFENVVAGASARGIHIHRASETEREAWRAATKDVPAKIIADAGGRSQELYDTILRGKVAFAAQAQRAN